MKFKVGDKIKIKDGQPLRPADYDLEFHPDMTYEISAIHGQAICIKGIVGVFQARFFVKINTGFVLNEG